MNTVTENELKAHQEKIGGKRVTLDALKEEMMKEVPSGDFRDRVKAEARDLMDKIQKLSAFMGGSVHWDNLPQTDQELLSRQLTLMGYYYDVLMKRISQFY